MFVVLLLYVCSTSASKVAFEYDASLHVVHLDAVHFVFVCSTHSLHIVHFVHFHCMEYLFVVCGTFSLLVVQRKCRKGPLHIRKLRCI